MRHPIRVLRRLGAFLWITTGAVMGQRKERRRVEGRDEPARRAAWMHGTSRRVLPAMGMRMEHAGRVPGRGLVVCNHLGYLDIPVLAATGPMVFVSKAEVRYWPGLGTLARCGGTLFLKREARGQVAAIGRAIEPMVEAGTVVTLFPEGTSTGGDRVLAFGSSLLEPAAARGWPVTPAWISYEVDEGTVAEDVAYWRDMTFVPHFLNLLARGRVVGRVRYGEPLVGAGDRKALSRGLHEAVCRLREEGWGGVGAVAGGSGAAL
ncbi:MAG: 1-acyl-sn-glycerol-3-phosphate acyltransferase [Verrucomicrobiae bacterium]|nr:1-acyl-sn-glycerol-3-phosphate acyltransferase [Verrucomicrobiae bacterium]